MGQGPSKPTIAIKDQPKPQLNNPRDKNKQYFLH